MVAALAAFGVSGCDRVSWVRILDARLSRNDARLVVADIELEAAEKGGGNVGSYCVSIHYLPLSTVLGDGLQRYPNEIEQVEQCADDLSDGDQRTFRLISTIALDPNLPARVQVRQGLDFVIYDDVFSPPMKRLFYAISLLGLVTLAMSLVNGCALASIAVRAPGPLFHSSREVKKLTNAVDKDARLAVLWIGHATALIQIDDKLILTDPVFTSSVGQLSKRLVEPGFDPENLPKLDAVLISHLHFDHLSLGSLSEIEPKVRMLLMPPTGVMYLTDFSFPVLELKRWQAYEKDGLRITATPVQHVGFRYGIDSAWMDEGFTAYVIEYHGLKVYFGGDSAYRQELYVETGERFPDIDVALLPIAPIEPHEFMRRTHMDPHEALQAFFDLGAKNMVPIHYDTFVNSTDEPGDALRVLGQAQKEWDLQYRKVAVVGVGERKVFLKVGEKPAAKPTISDDGSSTSATPPEAPSKPAPKKDDIPDDEKLDGPSAPNNPAPASSGKPTPGKPTAPGKPTPGKPASGKPAPASSKPAPAPSSKPAPKKGDIPDDEKLD